MTVDCFFAIASVLISAPHNARKLFVVAKNFLSTKIQKVGYSEVATSDAGSKLRTRQEAAHRLVVFAILEFSRILPTERVE